MNLKQLLSLAAVASASASDRDGRSLEDPPPPPEAPVLGIACIMGGGDKTMQDCCPCALPSEGVCYLLWCIDLETLALRDECSCGQVATACDQMGALGFLALAPELQGTCDQVGTCCDGGAADGAAFNGCLKDAVDAGTITVPDLGNLIPGGIPKMEGSPVCPDPAAPPANLPEGGTPPPGDGPANLPEGDPANMPELPVPELHANATAGNATAPPEVVVVPGDDHEGHDHGEDDHGGEVDGATGGENGAGERAVGASLSAAGSLLAMLLV